MGLSTDRTSKEVSSNGAVDEKTEQPPSYDLADEVVLALPKLNLDNKPNNATKFTVSPDQCVAHLKLLAVLADLRDFISGNDGLFGISDSQADKFPGSLDQARARIREKRWAVFTARAVDRYTKWWFTCLPMSRPNVSMRDLEVYDYETIVDCATQVLWSKENLPPLGEFNCNSLLHAP